MLGQTTKKINPSAANKEAAREERHAMGKFSPRNRSESPNRSNGSKGSKGSNGLNRSNRSNRSNHPNAKNKRGGSRKRVRRR